MFIDSLFRIGAQKGFRLPNPVPLPLGTFQYSDPPSEWQQILDLKGGIEIWEDLLKTVPTSLKTIMGSIFTTDEMVLQLGERIREGMAVGACNGSLRDIDESHHPLGSPHPQKGSHGYLVVPIDAVTEGVRGCATSPPSDAMTSLTTEHYGFLALVVTLHLVCIRCHLYEYNDIPLLRIWIDNAELVRRLTGKHDLINVSDYMAPEWDTWALSSKFIDTLPFPLDIQWVRSHQDENKQGTKLPGPHKLPVGMNIDADRMAALGGTFSYDDTLRRPVFSTSGAILHHPSTSQHITDLRTYLMKTVNGARLLDYHCDRNRHWDYCTPELIDWPGLGAYMKQQGPIHRHNVIKMIFGWQYTGSQAHKFSQARANNQPPQDPPPAPTTQELCPAHCGQLEGQLHYLTCQTEYFVEERADRLSDLIRELRRLKTFPGLIQIVREAIQDFCAGDEVSVVPPFLATALDRKLGLAVQEQSQIGWGNLLKGLVSKQWMHTQNEYVRLFDVTTPYRNGEGWSRQFIAACITFTWSMWTWRNELVHGNTSIQARQLKRKELQDRIRALYRQRKMLIVMEDKQVFKMPLYLRLRQGIHQMQTWVNLAEAVFALHRERLTKNTMLRWLGGRTGPPQSP